ncbi:MAG: hypothetical protein RL291_1035, partial [Pseudomonadota bacterium]
HHFRRRRARHNGLRRHQGPRDAVKVWRTRSATLGPGELFGELAVLGGNPRMTTAKAAADGTEIMHIDRGQFFYLVASYPGFSLLTIETVARWLKGGGTPQDPTVSAASSTHGAPFDVVPVAEGLWLFRTRTRSSNAILAKGPAATILFDPGLGAAFPALEAALASVGVALSAITRVALTHEHYDHVAAAPLVSAPISAHPLTASKIALQDDLTIYSESFGEQISAFAVTSTTPSCRCAP